MKMAGVLGTLFAMAFSVSAGAVGLGPLVHSGLTNTDRKGFYLTLINPYPGEQRFRLYTVGWDDELPESRVVIPAGDPLIAGRSKRRVLIIATGLTPGEERNFRVCAERARSSEGEFINARVCSRVTARRLS